MILGEKALGKEKLTSKSSAFKNQIFFSYAEANKEKQMENHKWRTTDTVSTLNDAILQKLAISNLFSRQSKSTTDIKQIC